MCSLCFSDGSMKENFHKILLNFYDLGHLIYIEKNHRGYRNETYKIETLKDNKKNHYILRYYRKGTLEERVMFEIALMHELIQQGFDISPHVIPTKNHTAYAKLTEKTGNLTEDRYITICSCLPGEDKYDWIDPLCTDTEFRDAAKVLAFYHSAICEWRGIDGWMNQRCIDKVFFMPDQWLSFTKNAGNSSFDQYFLDQFEFLYSVLCKIQFKNRYNEMPHLVIHGDYHPGNIKFQDGKVSGIFDFDWSNVDLRCFDVAIALLYFCSAWNGIDAGNLLLDRIESFLGAYQEAAENISGIEPLNTMELEHLPEMIHLSNLSLIDWVLGRFYTNDHDPDEYKDYLLHSVQVGQWMERSWDQLYKCILGQEFNLTSFKNSPQQPNKSNIDQKL